MTSRYILHQPGEIVPVEVTDDAQPGDVVGLSGESDSFTQVETQNPPGIGVLISESSTADASLLIHKPVVWVVDSGSNSVGDKVIATSDGEVQAASDPTMALGTVFSTRARSLHIGDRIAVALER